MMCKQQKKDLLNYIEKYPIFKDQYQTLKKEAICKKCGHDNSEFIVTAGNGNGLSFIANYCTQCGNKLDKH